MKAAEIVGGVPNNGLRGFGSVSLLFSIDLQMTSSQIIIEVCALAAMIPSVNVTHRTGTGNAFYTGPLKTDAALKEARPSGGQL